MTDVIEMIGPVTGEIIDQQQIAERLLAEAKEKGVSLVGPDAPLVAEHHLSSSAFDEAGHVVGVEDHAMADGARVAG